MGTSVLSRVAFVVLASLGWPNGLKYHAARTGDFCVLDGAIGSSKHRGGPPAGIFDHPASPRPPKRAFCAPDDSAEPALFLAGEGGSFQNSNRNNLETEIALTTLLSMR